MMALKNGFMKSAAYAFIVTMLAILAIIGALRSPAVYGGEPVLTQDPRIGTDAHLHNFRKATDKFVIPTESEPSREGLSFLRASGSAQFSPGGLRRIKERLKDEKIMVIDLREESHGFINAIPVSWRAEHNWANKGKSLEVIESDERQRLDECLAKKSAMITSIKKKDEVEEKFEETVPVKSVQVEKEVCRAAEVSYLRLPVSDHSKPYDRAADEFVKFMRSRPRDLWLHFHCKEGKGRTTTFMVFCDIFYNAKEVSLDDIVRRQHLLGGSDLFGSDEDEADWKKPLALERADMIRKFYEYCRGNKDNYKTLWTTWAYAQKSKPENKGIQK
jgi:hypothetical protein